MADTNEKILEAIRETLPETQVGLIKEALVERDSLKKDNKALNKALEESEREYRALDQDYNDLRKEKDSVDSKIGRMRVQVKELQNTNAELENREVRREADIARAELQGVQQTQQLFLKNTIVREAYQHQVENSGTSVQTHYVNGQQVAVPTPYSTHVPVTDVTEKTPDAESDEVRG